MLLSVAIGCCGCVLLLCTATVCGYCLVLLRAAIACCYCVLLLHQILLPLPAAAPCCCSLLLLPVAALQTVSVGGFSERLSWKLALFHDNSRFFMKTRAFHENSRFFMKTRAFFRQHLGWSFLFQPPAASSRLLLPPPPPGHPSLPARPVDIRGVRSAGPLAGIPRISPRK